MYFIPFSYNSCHAEVREVHRILMVHVAKKTSDESYMWYGSNGSYGSEIHVKDF